MVNLSKFHVISPKLINHSMPRTISQHPRGRSMISEVKTVFWISQENPLTIVLI
ncbi:hypothetical protein Fmac_032963 [Flemingia macrophylla]|uniref:Uncharacterized protein n=1 Tax=Flemingia macrophylla TaxID=520843 RepID=A0ABD1L6E1_9FABA